jgi:hypothetical protein
VCVDRHATQPLIADQRSSPGPLALGACVGVLLYDTSGFAGGQIFIF